MGGNGFVKIHRKIVEWEFYKDVPTRLIWEHLIYTSCYNERHGKNGVKLDSGQILTTINALSEENNISRDQTRRALRTLLDARQITTLRKSNSLLITITNWIDYQTKPTPKPTPKPTQKPYHGAPSLIVKKKKEGQIERLYLDHYPRKIKKKQGMKTLCNNIKSDEQLKNFEKAIRNYASYVKEEKTEERYIMHFNTFANCWEDYVDFRPSRKYTGDDFLPR